jgi:alpha-2-macroglobulin
MEKYRKWILIGGGVFAALAVCALAAYLVLSGPAKSGSLLARLENTFSSVTEPFVTHAVAGDEFAFQRLDIDTTKREAEACLVFTRDLDASGRTRYADYLSIENTSSQATTKAALHVVGPRLCLAGLDFNATYNVTLKTGLPAASGERLKEDETVPVELRDKPAVVRFTGGIIWPRETMQGVPLVTVNVDKAKLKLIRVGDRLLSQIESGAVDETTLYSWSAQEIENNQGQMVWSGTVSVKNVHNDSVVTLIPIGDTLKDRKPGAYVLIAIDANAKANDEGEYDYDSGEMAVQWLVDSDIALTVFKGGAGLDVFARSYATAEPLKNVKLTLVARDNNELGSVTTDSDGRATFAAGLLGTKGGDAPVMVMAYGAGKDFSFIDLRRSSFDLSDRGVGGREAPGPVDAYLYTERGVYRPGETVQLTAMIRDRIGASLSAPLTLIATRPDGMETARTTIAGGQLAAGAAAWKLALSKNAPHGRWQVAAYIDPKGDPIGRVQFDVHDFVPQKLKVQLAALTPFVAPGGTIKVKAESRFLYGAPAGGLSGEGVARIVEDPAPFAEYNGWRFGRVEDEFQSTDITMDVPLTDAAGATVATAALDKIADTTLPLKAKVRIDIHEPGGRTTAKSLDIPVRNHDLLIGIRPDFTGGAVAENTRASFSIVALDASGKRVSANGLTYSFVREENTYQWYRDDSGWKYKATARDRLITSGTAAIGVRAPLRLTQTLPWGEYRLTLTDPKTHASTSFRYWSGWAASSEGDRPDRIPVASDKPRYRAGETAHIRIKPQSSGKALVVVAGDRIFTSKTVDVPAEGGIVDVPVKSEWGAGAYVLVTAYRPLKSASSHEPVRAIGLTWLTLDNSDRTLTPVLKLGDKVRPRQHLVVQVAVKGLAKGEAAYLTLAAVDEGILQLTDYASPDPAGYYFGKRRLGLEMRDDYGRLIKPEKGDVGAMREGGDAFGSRALAVVPTKTVALFSGLVKLDGNGNANVPLDIPDFNGELRLMAVAVSANKLGASSRPLTVRDAVVADVVLPRFLAPGDRAFAALNLNNVEGKPGNYAATVKVYGPLALAGGATGTVVTQNLPLGKRTLTPVEIAGRGTGIGTVVLTVTGPGGFNVSHSWQIEVRAPQLEISRSDTVPFAAASTYVANASLTSGIVPGSGGATIDVSAAYGFANIPALLKWLDKYPFGCIEQQSSRAMPLLFFNDMASLAKLPTDNALKDREQAAVDAVLAMQNPEGNFGMWGPGADAEPWISVFALDFLTQAKAKNYVVPNEALRRGGNWLKRAASTHSNDDNVRAYAFYLLARSGQVNVSDLRYFSDTRGAEWNTVIAAALTGAAAARVGDKSRAAYGFKRALDIAGKAQFATYPVGDYGSLLRDLAGAMALASEAGETGVIPAFMAKARSLNMGLNATTTQEKAWMLRAAFELTRQRTRLNILVNGKPAELRAGGVHLAPEAGALAAGITLVNKGDAPVWRSVAVQGMPSSPLPPAANGLTLTKSIWTISGAPANLAALRQNDRVIVVLSGRMGNNAWRQMGTIDLLPAGLEIEKVLSKDDAKRYGFIGTLTDADRLDAADDRFIAAFTIGSRFHYRGNDPAKVEPQPEFRVGYIARVVTAGEYVLPAGVVEDMYMPGILARTSMGKVTVRQ